MIYIFYCASVNQLDEESFNFFLKKVPENIQSKILRLKNWDDRQRSLFSKLLLVKGLNVMELSAYSLDQIMLSEYQRPYFNSNIDFNISHSGEFIICGISVDHKLGIDIEEIKEIPLDDFENQFSEYEMKAIMNSENRLQAFYTLWTQKEAFLKAIGTGLHVPLNEIGIEDKTVKWNNQDWFLSEISFGNKYVSHLCTNFSEPKLIIEEITL